MHRTPMTPTPEPTLPALVPLRDVAQEHLACSMATLYRLLAAGSIAAVKLGRRTYVRRDELRRFLAALPPSRPAA